MQLGLDEAAASLNENQLGTILGWVAVLILGSGVLILIFRVTLEGTPKRQRRAVVDTTMIRSWLAVALVSGLLLFAAVSFVIDETDLRNLLMGGVIASAGTATAFYFASKTSEQAQQNLLNAAFGTAATITLPNLVDMKAGDGRKIIEALGLTFKTEPAEAVDEKIVTMTPAAGASVKPKDTVTATTAD